MGELRVADVRAQVALSLFTDFEPYNVVRPAAHHEDAATTMLDQVIAWGTALRPAVPRHIALVMDGNRR
ncbi:MAG TPA: hypothetical protein VF462_05995 [Micromonosporaceae bacterium]